MLFVVRHTICIHATISNGVVESPFKRICSDFTRQLDNSLFIMRNPTQLVKNVFCGFGGALQSLKNSVTVFSVSASNV